MFVSGPVGTSVTGASVGAAIERNEPEREIFDYRDGILIKAIYATVQLSYAGLFLPNDVSVEKTAGYPVAGNGSVTFDYTLSVTNLGERVATGILVTDVLPAGLGYLADSSGGTSSKRSVSR